jgi:RNA polymerase sigma-70 factor (ECF subfamily)
MGTPPLDVPDVPQASSCAPLYDRVEVQVLLREVDQTARRLRRKLRISRQDEEDLRHDLIVDLLARLPKFDPERGTLGCFLNVVLAHRSSRIVHKWAAQRRLYGEPVTSLDQPLPNADGETLGDLIAESDGYGAIWQKTDRFASIEQRLDLERALASLDKDQRSLCIDLLDRTPEQISASGGGSRATVYRRLRDLRLGLTAAGLVPA